MQFTTFTFIMAQTRRYKHITIIGAGPIGLYAALSLKSLGIDVTVVDPRAGQYTRPAPYDPYIFTLFRKKFGDECKFISSPYYHIKDLERALYDFAIQKGVSIKQEDFVDFSEDGIQIHDSKNNTDRTIPSDLIIDATGSKRAVITKVNEHEKKQIFSTRAIVEDNPIKKHFLAYIHLNPEDAKLIYENQNNTNHPKRSVILKKIQSQFKWPYEVEPFFKIVSAGKNKHCVYCEIPPGLKEEQYDSWINIMLSLNSGKENITFSKLKKPKKYHKKPRFLPFVVDPQKLIGDFHEQKGMPFVLPVGDAQIEPHYQLGFGIISGVKRFDAFLSSLKIENGDIVFIDTAKYSKELSPIIEKHENDIITHMNKRKEKLMNEDKKSDFQHEIQSSPPDHPKEFNKEIHKLIQAYLNNQIMPEEIESMCFKAAQQGDHQLLRALIPKLLDDKRFKARSFYIEIANIAAKHGKLTVLDIFPPWVLEGVVFLKESNSDEQLRIITNIRRVIFHKIDMSYPLAPPWPNKTPGPDQLAASTYSDKLGCGNLLKTLAIKSFAVYKDERKKEFEYSGKEYKSRFSSLFKSYATATTKISAADKCIRLFNGELIERFSDDEIRALHDKRLCDILEENWCVLEPYLKTRIVDFKADHPREKLKFI